MWAADWILAAQRIGVLDKFDLRLNDDVLAFLAACSTEAPILFNAAEAACANG
jgi:hypothetical protein